MDKKWKCSALALGFVCGMLVTQDASAAGAGMLTPEQDEAIQKAGREYNRQYDIEHGYYYGGAPVYYKNTAPLVVPQAKASVPVRQEQKVQQKPANRTTALARPPQQQQVVSSPAAPKQGERQAQPSRPVRLEQPRQVLNRGQMAPATQPVRSQQANVQAARPLVRQEWMKASLNTSEADRRMQEAGMQYNLRYDAAKTGR